MAGAPFEFLEGLATEKISQLARELIAAREEFENAKRAVEERLRSRGHGLSEEEFHAWRRAIRAETYQANLPAPTATFRTYLDVASRLTAKESQFPTALTDQLDAARAALVSAAETVLPSYLVFDSEGLALRLPSFLRGLQLLAADRRNTRARERERLLFLYLQRVCGKNDTFSEFGPTAWGTTAEAATALSFSPQAGISRRDAFLERWTAHAVAAAVAADPDAPNKPAVPALNPYATQTIVDEVRTWPQSPVRARWLAMLEPLSALPNEFKHTTDTSARVRIMDEAHDCLRQLGAARTATQRHLYAATNPIGEDCAREANFVLSQRMADELTNEAEPWIDLWRDSYAFIASRVAAGLRKFFATAPVRDGAVALPDFLAHCAAQKMPLTGHGIVALAHLAFQEVKAAFGAQINDRADAAELQLSRDDCHVVRRNFEYAKFDEYTYPSADLQISAASIDAVAHGKYEWILSELHPPIAMLHHCFWWSCPDHAALSDAMRSTLFGVPSFHYGFFAADFTAHTTVRAFDALPDLTTFVAPQLSKSKWRSVPPFEAEVFVDETTGDVRVRVRGSREYLGSFARAWIIPLGFHPFHFERKPHIARLRCGKVIVQRRAWTISQDELRGNFAGVSRELVIAVEKLRSARDLPRFVYIRPTEQALRRSGAEGRDKDTKPIFVDLESYLSLEVFQRWLSKSGELEVTEMLPDPDHLLWREADGRRTFELRTMIVPRV